MAKLSKKAKEEIIKRDLPGYKVAAAGHSDEIDALWAAPEASSPDLDALRKRYLGTNSPTGNASGEAEVDTPSHAGAGLDEEELEDEIVPVEPEAESDSTDRRSHVKVAIVSGKDGKVVGTQG